MGLLPLKNGLFAIVDDDLFDDLNNRKWSLLWNGYVRRRNKGANTGYIYLHNLIMQPSEGLWVDHIDGNKLDNRRSNLRICTHSQNTANRKRKSGEFSSLYKGVTFDKNRNRWRASIAFNGKRRRIGDFMNELEAAQAYNEAAIKTHGEFAKLNNIEPPRTLF